jgi:hypothetical protein
MHCLCDQDEQRRLGGERKPNFKGAEMYWNMECG